MLIIDCQLPGIGVNWSSRNGLLRICIRSVYNLITFELFVYITIWFDHVDHNSHFQNKKTTDQMKTRNVWIGQRISFRKNLVMMAIAVCTKHTRKIFDWENINSNIPTWNFLIHKLFVKRNCWVGRKVSIDSFWWLIFEFV